MLRRTLYYSGDFRTSKLAEEFAAFSGPTHRAGTCGPLGGIVNKNTTPTPNNNNNKPTPTSTATSTHTIDHIAIDIGPLLGHSARYSKGLLGSDRDAETLRYVERQLFQNNGLLRRFPAVKSIALFMDGTDPLWKIRRSRKFPGKKQEGRFYRSCAVPVAYQIEERLRLLVLEQYRMLPSISSSNNNNYYHGGGGSSSPPEILISGPAVPGPAEAKISAWLWDLASRIKHPVLLDNNNNNSNNNNTPSSSDFISVTAQDNILLVGQEELFLAAVAAVPFHNMTAIVHDGKEARQLTLQGALEWLGVEPVLENAITAASSGNNTNNSSSSSSGAPAATNNNNNNINKATPLERLARVRLDAVLLYLISHGCSATDANGCGVPFTDLMQSYIDLAGIHANPSTSGSSSNKEEFFIVQLDDNAIETTTNNNNTNNNPPDNKSTTTPPPPNNTNTSDTNNTNKLPTTTYGIALDLLHLERLLTKAARRSGNPAENKACAEYLEILAQSVAMYAAGGIRDYSYTPPTPLVEAPPPMKMDQLIGHIKWLSQQQQQQQQQQASTNTPQAQAGNKGGKPPTTTNNNTSASTTRCRPLYRPSCDSTFALTPAEQLLVSAETTEIMKLIAPAYANGHAIPDAVLETVTQCADITQAVEAARTVLSYLTVQEGDKNTSSSNSSNNKDGKSSSSTSVVAGAATPLDQLHPALRHCPSSLYYRPLSVITGPNRGSLKLAAPMYGYTYAPVCLGGRSMELHTATEVMQGLRE